MELCRDLAIMNMTTVDQMSPSDILVAIIQLYLVERGVGVSGEITLAQQTGCRKEGQLRCGVRKNSESFPWKIDF